MKRLFSVLLLVFFFVEICQAASIEMENTYLPSETVIARISGEISAPIDSSQVRVKRGGVEIAVEYGVARVGGDYYLWFIAPQNIENYSVQINNVHSVVNGLPAIVTLQKSFSVAGDRTEYNIKPGLIVSAEDFEISATVFSNDAQTIDSDFPSQRTLILKPGLNKIRFDTSEVVGSQLFEVSFGKYVFPAYIVGGSVPQNETLQPPENNATTNVTTNETTPQNATQNETKVNGSIETSPTKFHFRERVIRAVIFEGAGGSSFEFEIINDGNDRIDGLFFDYDRNVFSLAPDRNISIEPSSSAKINLTLNLESINKNNFRDAIIGYASNYSDYFFFIFESTNSSSEVKTDYIEEISAENAYYCSELGGILCTAEEVCNGESVSALDGLTCCISGRCEETTNETSYAWVGYLIAALLLIVGLVVYSKYKKTKTAIV